MRTLPGLTPISVAVQVLVSQAARRASVSALVR